MTLTTFDLRRRPWLPVRLHDGSLTELSLIDAVARAREVRELVGDLPTQTFALHRLLLALLHRAVPWERGRELEQWRAVWDGDLDLVGPVTTHLDRWTDRFDLLHPQTPFFQVAGLATAKGAVSPLTSLVADVPNGHQYFTTRAGRPLERIGLAEAARWVVHVQAFDPSGIKSGALGDPRVKNGKGYPIGTGWSGGLGGLCLEGRNLHETLLLNLLLHDRDERPWPGGDSAVWERAPQSASVEATDRAPTGPADLLTWQSRRVRLATDGEGVTGVVIANGDPLEHQNSYGLEGMTGWRRSEAQEKVRKQPLVYMPRRHAPQRALWRGLPGMLALGTRASKGEATATLAPGVLRWVEVLLDDGLVEDDFPLRTRAVGVEYGPQQSTVSEIVDDALSMHAVLLGKRGKALRARAVEAVEVTDAAVRALAGLAGNLSEAAGGSPDDATAARDGAREQAYFSLDAPFRTWLGSLRTGVDPHERREVWERFVDQALRDLAAELLADAGTPAWVGRDVRGRNGARHVDSSLAHAWFAAALRKALVLARPPLPASPDAPRPGTHEPDRSTTAERTPA